MIYPATPAHLDQAERFHLRFGCEDCAHFEVERGLCSFDYPNHEHRRAAPVELKVIVFCKAFELV